MFSFRGQLLTDSFLSVSGSRGVLRTDPRSPNRESLVLCLYDLISGTTHITILDDTHAISVSTELRCRVGGPGRLVNTTRAVQSTGISPSPWDPRELIDRLFFFFALSEKPERRMRCLLFPLEWLGLVRDSLDTIVSSIVILLCYISPKEAGIGRDYDRIIPR